MVNWVWQKFVKDFGIDLGTSNSLVYLKGKGIVVNEPSIVALNNKTSQILAVGDSAKKMLGREPTHVSVVRPLVGGVVSDFDITEEIIRQFLNRFKSYPVSYFNRVVATKSLKIAGDRFNSDILDYIREEFRLVIGEPTAEALKIAIGSAMPIEGRLELSIRGRDLSSGLPREVIVKNNQIRLAIGRSLHSIVENIKTVIEATPPELVGDILERGIYLCGGGSLLRGIDQLIKKELSINATIVDDPLTCVVRGVGSIIEDFQKYNHLFAVEAKVRAIKL